MGLEQFDSITRFAVSAVTRALERIHSLGGTGVEVVARREAGYREWDPETIKVDREAEDVFVNEVERSGWNVVLLSEELKRKEFVGSGERLYVISDPFDGSLLYKRQIPAFWFTSLAVYNQAGEPLTAAVGDCITNTIDFCDRSGAYTAALTDGEVQRVAGIRPRQTTELKEAFLETYLMKPKFLYPCVEVFEPLFKQVKFVLPNGGPAGFTDVAKGRIDIYFAYQQPHVEVFSGVAIAQKAGCVVTTFDGQDLKFEEDINKLYDVLCCATPQLHKRVMEVLAGINFRR